MKLHKFYRNINLIIFNKFIKKFQGSTPGAGSRGYHGVVLYILESLS